MGNQTSIPPSPLASMTNPNSVNNQAGNNIFKVPNNSSTIDIDVPNLQKCINAGGGTSCINNYVQGYDTSTNMFVPTTNVIQGFELLETNNFYLNDDMVLIILIILYIFVAFRK